LTLKKSIRQKAALFDTDDDKGSRGTNQPQERLEGLVDIAESEGAGLEGIVKERQRRVETGLPISRGEHTPYS
jgi:hypothetical protein